MQSRTILTSASVMGLPAVNSHWRYSALTLVAALAVITALVNPIAGQTFRGTILGTVSDANGAVVPEATVTAKNVATGIERSTVSDSSGNYTLAELQTGTYTVTAQKSGFAIPNR